MIIAITTITRCPGTTGTNGKHYVLTGTLDGAPRTLELTKDEIETSPEDVKQAAIQRLRSHILENGLGTFASIKNSLEGSSFHI